MKLILIKLRFIKFKLLLIIMSDLRSITFGALKKFIIRVQLSLLKLLMLPAFNELY